MSNEYDKIFRENILALFLPISEKYLGVAIQSSRALPGKIQFTKEREPDFIREITTPENEKLILHLEFQTSDEKGMDARMLEYYALYWRKYRLPIQQVVIYLGTQPIKHISGEIKTDVLQFTFGVLEIRKLPSDELLNSEVPEEVLLAILAAYPKKQASAVIRKIINSLIRAVDHKPTLIRYLNQLTVLSKLRKLEDVTEKEVNAMPVDFDIETSYLFNKGRKKGKEEGEQVGIDKTILNMLKLNKLSIAEIAEFANVEESYVLKLKEQLGKC
jgi:predicted transposase YdaD